MNHGIIKRKMLLVHYIIVNMKIYSLVDRFPLTIHVITLRNSICL